MQQTESDNRLLAFEHLGESLAQIKNSAVTASTLDVLAALTSNYFWEFLASTSGKYHPPKARKRHGLVWHTNFTVKWGLQLVDRVEADKNTAIDNLPLFRDVIIQALILHDLWKNGKSDFQFLPSPDTVGRISWPKGPTGITGTHGGLLAVHLFREDSLFFLSDDVIWAIGAHMGPWTDAKYPYWAARGNDTAYRHVLIETVQMADYCASRYFGEDHEG